MAKKIKIEKDLLHDLMDLAGCSLDVLIGKQAMEAEETIAEVSKLLLNKEHLCGVLGPREATSPCILNKNHQTDEHEDSSGGTWLNYRKRKDISDL